MSYILDALKKSEQERGQGDIPNVQTVHSSSLNYGNNKKTYWPYILITAVLLNLLAISYFIFDKEKDMDINSQPASELASESAAPTFKETLKQIGEEDFKKEEKPTVKPIQKKLPKTINSNTSLLSITDYYDLPDSTKNRLPDINVSAHVFSTNPLQRSIVINNNFMEEGEYISKKLFLHEITQDGAILDFEGDLINYGVVSKWQ